MPRPKTKVEYSEYWQTDTIQCNRCKNQFPLDHFGANKRSSTGRQYTCLRCSRDCDSDRTRHRTYYYANRENRLEYLKRYKRPPGAAKLARIRSAERREQLGARWSTGLCLVIARELTRKAKCRANTKLTTAQAYIFMVSDREWWSLFEAWRKSGYEPKLRPTYLLLDGDEWENGRWVSWLENKATHSRYHHQKRVNARSGGSTCIEA